jgi:hypothetical protein
LTAARPPDLPATRRSVPLTVGQTDRIYSFGSDFN